MDWKKYLQGYGRHAHRLRICQKFKILGVASKRKPLTSIEYMCYNTVASFSSPVMAGDKETAYGVQYQRDPSGSLFFFFVNKHGSRISNCRGESLISDSGELSCVL